MFVLSTCSDFYNHALTKISWVEKGGAFLGSHNRAKSSKLSCLQVKFLGVFGLSFKTNISFSFKNKCTQAGV